MITLHAFGPAFGLADASPFVTKTLIHLKMSGQPFQVDTGHSGLLKAPKGKKPYIVDEGKVVASRPEPDWARVHLELHKKHVTKQLLWEEYKTEQPEGYQYSQFCERYAQWASTLNVTMRQTHRAGEKLFLDFSGDGVDLVDPKRDVAPPKPGTKTTAKRPKRS